MVEGKWSYIQRVNINGWRVARVSIGSGYSRSDNWRLEKDVVPTRGVHWNFQNQKLIFPKLYENIIFVTIARANLILGILSVRTLSTWTAQPGTQLLCKLKKKKNGSFKQNYKKLFYWSYLWMNIIVFLRKQPSFKISPRKISLYISFCLGTATWGEDINKQIGLKRNSIVFLLPNKLKCFDKVIHSFICTVVYSQDNLVFGSDLQKFCFDSERGSRQQY